MCCCGDSGAHSPCDRLAAPVSGCKIHPRTAPERPWVDNGRSAPRFHPRRDFAAPWVENALFGRPEVRRTCFWVQIWTTDDLGASAVPERPVNMQIWTTDGQTASVVQNRTRKPV